MALTRITKGVIKPNENYDTHNINSTGIVTAIGLDVNGNGDVSGNLNVGGVLTYEDVTSIDSVGIITAQSDIHVGAGLSVVGVGTFGNIVVGAGGSIAVGTGITFETNGQGTFSGIVTARNFDVGYSDGAITYGYFQAGRIKIFDNGSHLHFRGGTHPSFAPNQRYFSSVVERTNAYSLQNTAATRYGITWNNNDGPVHLYYSKGYAPDYSIKLSTTAKGITVGSGVTIETNGQANFVGVTTFTETVNFDGNLSGSNANFTGELTVAEMVGHTGDTHTKLSFPANDTIAFTTGGTERARITSEGKLLVGATSVTNGSIAEFSKSVAGGGAGCHITVENTSNNSVNNTAGIHLKTATGTAKFFKYQAAQTFLQSASGGASELILQASGAHPMRLYTNGDERVRITSTGQVNIGGNFSQNSYNLSVYTASGASIIAKSASSTHPTANIWCHNDTANWLALGVWGSAANTSGLITANDAIVGSNNDLCLYSTNASGSVKFGAGSGYPELMRLTSSGNLNITGDLTQTSYVLSVTNSSNTNLFRIKTANEGDYDLRFNIQNSESHMWHYGTDDFVIGNRYDRKLHFITNGSKRLTIHGSYIGINQTAPQTGLHINQDWVNSYGSVSVEGSANALVGFGLRSNGNYRGSLIWRDGSSGNYMDISTYGNAAYDILFRPNGSERARVTSGGLKISKTTSGVAAGALRINTDYTNYGTIIVRDNNETHTACLQAENANSGASTENRIYRSVNLSSSDWAGANLEARFHNFRIQGSTSSHDKFTITNNGARSNGTVSGTVCNSFRANTSFTNYGVFTARDASSANEHNAAFQVENPSTGSDTTNQFMRSVDASSANWANAKYSAKSHRFHTGGSNSGSIVLNITDTGHAVHFGNQTSLAKYNDGNEGCSWYDDKDSWQQGQSGGIGWSMMYFNKKSGSDNRIMHFFNNGTTCGYINRVTDNTTQYQTSSDYRLKKDVVALPNGIERVKQLRPVAFKWKSNNGDMEGFLAHEAQEIVPYAVSGKKDEVATEDHGDKKKGDMIVQGVDYGEFTPLLTAAMKELIAKVETLEAKVAILEGKI